MTLDRFWKVTGAAHAVGVGVLVALGSAAVAPIYAVPWWWQLVVMVGTVIVGRYAREVAIGALFPPAKPAPRQLSSAEKTGLRALWPERFKGPSNATRVRFLVEEGSVWSKTRTVNGVTLDVRHCATCFTLVYGTAGLCDPCARARELGLGTSPRKD